MRKPLGESKEILSVWFRALCIRHTQITSARTQFCRRWSGGTTFCTSVPNSTCPGTGPRGRCGCRIRPRSPLPSTSTASLTRHSPRSPISLPPKVFQSWVVALQAQPPSNLWTSFMPLGTLKCPGRLSLQLSDDSPPSYSTTKSEY